MAQHNENRPIDGAVELLKTNGFDGLAEAVTVLPGRPARWTASTRSFTWMACR